MNEPTSAVGQGVPLDDPLDGYIFWKPILYDQRSFELPLEELLKSLPDAVGPAAAAFTTNLRAVFFAASLPYMLCFFESAKHQVARHVTVARIRNIPIEEVVHGVNAPDHKASEDYLGKRKAAEERAVAEAVEKLHQAPGKSKLRSQAAVEALISLKGLLGGETIQTAARTLLDQSLVLTWVAFEALSSALFVTMLNAAPHLTTSLLRNEKSKKRFQVRDLLRVIEGHGFDLSNKMGDVLTTLGHLDDLETIKAVFEALMPENNGLRDALSRPELWVLYQRRNLIVHRGGIVDRHFLEKTGETLQLGTKLIVTSDEVYKYLTLVRDAGIELTTGAASLSS